MSRPRVVIAGLGDSGLLTAIGLASRFDIVGISVKPGLVSGQELGVRVTRPADWARDYWIPFERFRGLDGVRREQATLTGVDFVARAVFAERADGTSVTEPYDVLVISTGVSNGFWRQSTLQSAAAVSADLKDNHDRLAAARSVIVVGGGAAAVSAAANLASTWPDKRIDLYFPRERALTEHHPGTWKHVQDRLIRLEVGLHPGHRAVIAAADSITSDPVQWSSGQAEASADAVLWAVGQVRPNTNWLPAEVLDERGFVRVTPQLMVVGHPGVFAVGDVAATDPLRSSARNRADRLLAGNIRAHVEGGRLRAYSPPKRRWGSVLGVQPDGLEVFTAQGRPFRFPAWSIDRVLQPWIVRRGIYRGIRNS